LSVIVTEVYIPSQADTKTAIKELHMAICKLEDVEEKETHTYLGEVLVSRVYANWKPDFLNLLLL
jgi:hypothetical protein